MDMSLNVLFPLLPGVSFIFSHKFSHMEHNLPRFGSLHPETKKVGGRAAKALPPDLIFSVF